MYQAMRDMNKLETSAPRMDEAYMAYIDSKPKPIAAMLAYAKGGLGRINSHAGDKKLATKLGKKALCEYDICTVRGTRGTTTHNSFRDAMEVLRPFSPLICLDTGCIITLWLQNQFSYQLQNQFSYQLIFFVMGRLVIHT